MRKLEHAHNHNTRAASDALKKVRSIIAISSCKGGVGKSTVAVHFALELSRRGYKVGLVDADLHGPSIPTLLNLNNQPAKLTANQQLIPHVVNGLKVVSFGFLLGDAPAVMRGPLVTRYIQQLIHATEWGELDYLLIDMPPGTGDIQLTITQSVPLSGAAIVTTRQNLSLIDVQRGILMFEKVSVPILGIIENMSYFVCDQCQKKHFIFGGSEGGKLQQRFGLDILAEIPLLPGLAQTIDITAPNKIFAEGIDRLLSALEKQQQTRKEIPKIEFDENEIRLQWPDGEKAVIANSRLRANCQCAVCVDEIKGRRLFDPAKMRPDIAPKEITALGNYAIGIIWNDGHSSGIYSYKLIRDLA